MAFQLTIAQPNVLEHQLNRLLIVKMIDFQAKCRVHNISLYNRASAGAGAKQHRSKSAISFHQRHFEMTVAGNRCDFLHGHFPYSKNRLSIAHAVRLQNAQLSNGLHGNIIRRNQTIDVDYRHQIFFCDIFLGIRANALFERRQHVSGNGKTGCQCMTTEFFQILRAVFQRFKEVEAVHRASGAFSLVSVQRNQHRRTSVSVGNAG